MMDPAPFILGSYVVTAIAIAVEIVAVRMRMRAATRAASGDDDASLRAADPEPNR